MTLTVRLPADLEQSLESYCAAKRISKSEAVKTALEQLVAAAGTQLSPYELGRSGFGVDDSQHGDVARNTKALMRERFRGTTRRPG